MPGLPDRADLDQLRRQARELLRAAAGGEPEAAARLRAVSERRTLAAAQLAIAREHGFGSWPALRSAAASGRPPAEQEPRAGTGQAEAPAAALGRWSFGGSETINAAEGELTLGLLIAGPEGAFLEGSLAVAPAIASARQPQRWIPDLPHATVTDDQGATYRLRFAAGYGGNSPRWEVGGDVNPVPARGSRWLDVQGPDNSVARLLRSSLAPARVAGPSPVSGSPAERELRDAAWSVLRDYLHHDRREGPDLKRRCRELLARAARLRAGGPGDGASPLPGQCTRLCTALIRQRPPSGLPRGWHSLLDAADRTDGPRRHVDLDTALPPADGTAVRLNTLASWPGSWDLHLQAAPGWSVHSGDRWYRLEAMTVCAEDDLGRLYLGNFGGSGRCPGYDEVKLTMRPALAPGARRLTLTFAGETEQVTVEIPLAP